MSTTVPPRPSPVSSQSIAERKAGLRRLVLARRKAANAREGSEAGLKLVANAQKRLPSDPAVVSGFWPVRAEIDVRPLLDALRARGWQVALPVVVENGAPLIFRAWNEGDAMDEGAFRIPEPQQSAKELTPTVMLVPLVAFDADGFRLGYGGGFYDRSIEKLSSAGAPLTVIGCAFDAQEVVRVPREAHDRQLDAILTPSRWRKPGPAGSPPLDGDLRG